MTDKYALVEEFTAGGEGFPISKMCAWIGVSASGFYDWRSRLESPTAARRRRLEALVAAAFAAGRGSYGYRRVHAQLVRWGEQASPELVRALMRQLGLTACQPRPYKVTTRADAAAAATPDLVGRDFTAEVPGTRLVGDITYIRTWEGWVYLATVLDCHSKRVIGWSMAEHMRTDLVCAAITMAATNVEFAPGAVFHSDHGSQRGFNGSSQHLDDGGVLRWQDAGRVLLTGRCGRGCGLRAGRRLGGGSSGSSGGGSLRASRARMRRPQWACLGRSGRAGFDTVAGCPRSVSRSRRAGTCRSPSGKRSRC